MKDKGHFYTSLVKSAIRIAGCVACIMVSYDLKLAVIVLAASLGVAELLGIAEEVFDKRK